MTTTGPLLSIVETHTDEFKTDFAVMAAHGHLGHAVGENAEVVMRILRRC